MSALLKVFFVIELKNLHLMTTVNSAKHLYDKQRNVYNLSIY